MNGTKIAAYGFATIFLASLLVVFVPSAVAQGEQPLTLKPPTSVEKGSVGLREGRLPPETGKYGYQFKFTVGVPQTVGAAVCPITPITVTFTPDNPNAAWSVFTLSTTKVTIPVAPQEQKTEVSGFDVEATVIIDRNAPAFKTGTYSISAKATAASNANTQKGCAYAPSDEQKVPLQIINDYLPIMEYAPTKYIQKTGQNKDVIFAIKMTNFGNGATKVTTSVTPGKKSLDALTPPSPVTLDSRAELGKDAKYIRDDVIVQARTPHSNGYTNSIYTFTTTFKATSPVTAVGVLEDSQFVTLSVQVQGVYVPGFDPTSAIAALGIALLGLGVARRRHG